MSKKKGEGYIQGDITSSEVKQKIFDEIDWWRQNRRITDIDVVVAPPLSGKANIILSNKWGAVH